MNRFIDEKKDNWQRLEDLLGMMGASGVRALTRMEVREFGELYRRAAADLAIARAETRDPRLINYLNSLVVRAHGRIYQADGDGRKLIRAFFARELPAAFRRLLPFSSVAFAVFMVTAVVSFVLCYNDPEFGNLLGLGPFRTAAETDMRWWLSLNEANQIGSSEILTNNIRVAFMAFAFGVFFGIGTIYVLFFNGMLIGGVLGVCYSVSTAFGNGLVNFMIGHGVVELACIFIAGGAGMAIGYSLIAPGDLPRGQAIKRRAVDAIRVVVGCALFLFVSGFIEGFISPSALPVAVKYGVGISTGAAMLGYLFLAGRSEAAKPANAL